MTFFIIRILVKLLFYSTIIFNDVVCNILISVLNLIFRILVRRPKSMQTNLGRMFSSHILGKVVTKTETRTCVTGLPRGPIRRSWKNVILRQNLVSHTQHELRVGAYHQMNFRHQIQLSLLMHRQIHSSHVHKFLL